MRAFFISLVKTRAYARKIAASQQAGAAHQRSWGLSAPCF